MKKFLIASGVAVLALASVASAQGYQFSANLTVGSTGPDVVALQTWLIANGYHIPSVESGAAAKGYFGSQTKAAVTQYQAASGLPSTGFFGPLTRGLLNGGAAMAGAVNTMTCPAGYVCTQVGSTAPTGTVSAPAGISTPGVPGTLSVSLWNSPSDGTTVYKGQSYDIVAYKLQASASDMAVQSISLDFNNRIWLYAGAITLKDDTGAVVGQVSNLTANSFSELTVGSDYRITIPISNYVVRSTQTRYITANLSFLATSDRTTGNLSVIQSQIRGVDGTGVTDTETTLATRTFSYQGNGAGQVVVTVDSSSPLTNLVQLSTGGQTQNVPLAVYDVKVQNAPANLRSISFVVNTTGVKKPEDLFSQYQLKIGGQTFGAQTITTNFATASSASTTVTFTNFGSITLAADTYVPLTLVATAQQDTNNVLDGTIASTTLNVVGTAGGLTNNPDVEDQSFSTLDVNDGKFISSNLTFSASSATVSNESASATAVGQNASIYNVSFNFTLTAGNNTLYVSAAPTLLVSTSTTGGLTAKLSTVQANPDTLPGDITGTEYVVSAGTTRTFTVSGSATGATSSNVSGVVKIIAVKYGLASGTYTNVINYNLGGLQTTSIAIP